MFLGLFKDVFIYFWLHWPFIAAHGLSLVAVSRGCFSLWAPIAGAPLLWTQALGVGA